MQSDREEFEETCNLFIKSVENYFMHLTNTECEVSVPYLKDSGGLMLKEITGMIGISGNRRGFVYISANRGMYKDLINIFIGLDDPADEDILDMAGEISNVVSGNVRANLGANFMISVPIVFEGMPNQLRLPSDLSVYIIPLKWKEHEAFVVVGLQ